MNHETKTHLISICVISSGFLRPRCLDPVKWIHTIPKRWHWGHINEDCDFFLWTLLKDRVRKGTLVPCRGRFFVRNCLLYENSSKNVDFHVPSCSEGSHPGWFHLAWGSNDGIWYRCRPPSANECSFQHSRVINRGIHENANNLPCTTTNATSSFISTTRGSNSVTGQFSKPWPTLTNHLF